MVEIGNQATLNRHFSLQDVESFARVTGDENPLHLDEEFASKTRFGKRIVHGMLTASLISAVLGNTLPGPGSIYIEQTLRFLAPVYIGDTVTAIVEVIGLHEDKRVVLLRTTCINQESRLVLEGKATLAVPEETI
jgi:acyl dehydratase